MKTHYLLTILTAMLLMVPNVMAQKSKKKAKETSLATEVVPFTQANLTGIWQMCFYVSESPDIPGELKTGNTFKVLANDGHITNFTYVPNKGAVITGTGTYKQVSDTVYHENIKRSIHLPMLNEQVNALTFEIQDDKLLRLKFYIEKDENDNVLDAWYYETWMRVEMPDKYPENLVR